jgi:Tfp pilus assembly protein PilN
MRALELDFVARPRRSSWQGAMLLLAGAIAVLELFSSHDELLREHASISDEIAQIERRGRGISAGAGAVDETTAQEIVSANGIIDQLVVPWDRLFRAVEGAAFDKVVLVSISPDVRAGTVEIMGETTDRETMMDYVRRLAEQPELSGVYLLSHQYEARGGVRPFRFTATASWLAKDNN